MLLLFKEAPPQGMRLMRTEVENHAGGRPPGLTLTESGVLNLPLCRIRSVTERSLLCLVAGDGQPKSWALPGCSVSTCVQMQAERMGTGWARAGLQRRAGGGAACLGSGGSWRRRTTCPRRARLLRQRRGRAPLPRLVTAWPGAFPTMYM